ncbi:hypothetical protein [Pseudanabaena sp. ABRG5-3]|uniref:hypothetical protein n=1 Tax=Pseudanabaena sp. ABRG5-3 TaxID=685565 RepID=UPI0013A66348|nr:hypothetical protein [Pseudanabaena sp. ABRG5-3]
MIEFSFHPKIFGLNKSQKASKDVVLLNSTPDRLFPTSKQRALPHHPKPDRLFLKSNSD